MITQLLPFSNCLHHPENTKISWGSCGKWTESRWRAAARTQHRHQAEDYCHESGAFLVNAVKQLNRSQAHPHGAFLVRAQAQCSSDSEYLQGYNKPYNCVGSKI